MSIIKLCALGNLDLEINLTLRLSEAELFKFEINEINKSIDLKEIFYNKKEEIKVNYLDYISLSSKNDFMNTILFINRAYKDKIFVEFIMLNQLEFKKETFFLKDLIKQICMKNFIFLIENKIFDIPCNIKFNIKILEDDYDKIISFKSINLFEKNSEIEEDEEDNFNLFNKINYNFSNTQFFLSNFTDLIKYKKEEYEEISLFFKNLIQNISTIKIISILNSSKNLFSEITYLDLLKDIIEYSDYIFSEKKFLNEFYKIYYQVYNIKISNEEKLDYILKDKDKKRKGIERITILIEENLESFQIYIQKGLKMEMTYNEYFSGKIIYKNNNEEKENENKKILNSKKKLLNGIFIGSFLSRLLNNKTIKTCITAGCLSIKNMIEMLKNKIDYITDIDLFNVIVPYKKKKSKREILENEILQIQKKLFQKEKGFILDCTNLNNNKKKEYNPLLDMYCQRFVFSKNNFNHLRKLGFINKNGKIINEPDLKNKKSILTKINLNDNNLYKTNSNFFSKKFSINKNNSDNMRKTFYSYSRIKTGKSEDKNYFKNLPLMSKSSNFFNKSDYYKRWSSISKHNNSKLIEKKYIKKKNNSLWNSNYMEKDVFLKILNSFEKQIS